LKKWQWYTLGVLLYVAILSLSFNQFSKGNVQYGFFYSVASGVVGARILLTFIKDRAKKHK